jgi:diguanylate cyclase (GGDEF)-like protein
LKAVADAELSGHVADRGLDAVVATLKIACQVSMAVVNIVTVDTQTYAAEVGVGAPNSFVADRLSFCAEVVDTGQAMTVPDAGAHPVYLDNPLVRSGHIGAYAGVPLIDNGVVMGTVSLFDDKARVFTAAELEILAHQAELASSVLALRRSARTDVLTGLPNRGFYLDRLEQTLAGLGRDGGQAAVMYVDVDEFKPLNDTFGHHVGDLVLVELAARLTESLRATDTVARFGGDEFVACIHVGIGEPIDPITRRLLEAIAVPWIIEDRQMSVSVSVGVALTDSPETPPADLLRQADAALYMAKQEAGPSWRFATVPRQSIGKAPFHRPQAAR